MKQGCVVVHPHRVQAYRRTWWGGVVSVTQPEKVSNITWSFALGEGVSPDKIKTLRQRWTAKNVKFSQTHRYYEVLEKSLKQNVRGRALVFLQEGQVLAQWFMDRRKVVGKTMDSSISKESLRNSAERYAQKCWSTRPSSVIELGSFSSPSYQGDFWVCQRALSISSRMLRSLYALAVGLCVLAETVRCQQTSMPPVCRDASVWEQIFHAKNQQDGRMKAFFQNLGKILGRKACLVSLSIHRGHVTFSFLAPSLTSSEDLQSRLLPIFPRYRILKSPDEGDIHEKFTEDSDALWVVEVPSPLVYQSTFAHHIFNR